MEIGPLIYHLRCDVSRHDIARDCYQAILIAAYTEKEIKILLSWPYVCEVWSGQVGPFCDVAAVIESIQEGDTISIWPPFYCCDSRELRKHFERLRDDPVTMDPLKASIPELYPVIHERPMPIAADTILKVRRKMHL